MQVKPISDTLSLSDQIQIADLQAIADQGFRSIICKHSGLVSQEEIAATRLLESHASWP